MYYVLKKMKIFRIAKINYYLDGLPTEKKKKKELEIL